MRNTTKERRLAHLENASNYLKPAFNEEIRATVAFPGPIAAPSADLMIINTLGL